MKTRIYDGAKLCHTSQCCPVIDFDDTSNMVTVHDPAKPENGSFTMTREEYNLLIANAQKV